MCNSKNHKNGKWAKQILALRHDDGMWGNFHTLSRPVSGKTYTTEQALRRLLILGYTIKDEPVQTIVRRMEMCIKGEKKIDGYYEKTHDWLLFEKLMLAAWIRIIEPENKAALEIAYSWASLAEKAFEHGRYDRDSDKGAFAEQHGRKPKSGFETGFGMFYHAALLKGVLRYQTESLFLDYCLSRDGGMYYVYGKPLNRLPGVFASRESSDYLAALEVLAEYDLAKPKLKFAADWLEENRDENGQWDFGTKANDGIYFPLSDSWRKAADRKSDCTERVNAFMKKVRGEGDGPDFNRG